MGEDSANVKNGDMAPQEQEVEDSAKLPLTDGSVAVEIIEDKTKEDSSGEYKGLTKDELMVYANDPKWKTLRLIMMMFFWLSWLAMLSIAIVIIVKAPPCDPPPSTTWLQKGPMLQLDVATPPKEAEGLLKSLGLNSLYIPQLISHNDYMLMNATYVKEKVLAIIEGLTGVAGASSHIVTDFVPSPIRSFHVWTLDEAKYGGLYHKGNLSLNYGNADLQAALETVFEHWKKEYNVTGFLVPGEKHSPDQRNLTRHLNQKLNPDVAFGEATVTVPDISSGDFAPFKSLVMENSDDWRFFKIRPAESAELKQVAAMRIALLVLMASSGTPVFEVPPTDVEFFRNNFTDVVRMGNLLREKDAIRYGNTTFVNSTENLASSIAFIRTLKGTPGYAVAANLDPSATATFDLTSAKEVPPKGSLAVQLGGGTGKVKSKTDMKEVVIGPLSAVVIQFVAKEV